MIKYIIMAFAVFFISMIARIRWELRHFEVVRYILDTGKHIRKNYKAAVITDLHSNRFGEENEVLIGAIDKEKPDFILIAGDLIVGNSREDFQTATELLEKLSRKYSVYYGNGNHESRLKQDARYIPNQYEQYHKKTDEMGVCTLENESVFLPGDDAMQVFGLEIDDEYFRKRTKIKMDTDYLNGLLGHPNPNNYTILIAHNPKYFSAYTAWGADLIISGHNHGGIIGTPFKRGLISTQFTLFEKYYKGIFHEKQASMIVSTGLGTHTLPIRLFNKQQLVIIELRGSL